MVDGVIPILRTLLHSDLDEPRQLLDRLGLEDNDIFQRLIARTRPHASNLLDNIHTINHLPKHSVLPIQVRCSRKRNEELATIRPRPAVSHRHNARAGMEKRVVELVFEFSAPNRLAAATGAGGVAALEHEARDDAVEDYAVILAGVGEACEVLTCLKWQCQSASLLVSSEGVRLPWASCRCTVQS